MPPAPSKPSKPDPNLDPNPRHVDGLARGSDACKVAAIVANCNLAAPDAQEQLVKIKAASALVRGIRQILDYDGPFDGACPTHIACRDHDTDYLRDPTASPAFERGHGGYPNPNHNPMPSPTPSPIPNLKPTPNPNPSPSPTLARTRARALPLARVPPPSEAPALLRPAVLPRPGSI